MKFLVDAQLPRRLCACLGQVGHDVLHTLDLPQRNATPDSVILAIAEREQRVIVTKDDDFVQSRLIFGRPEKLLLVATGNIGNPDLETLLRNNLPAIVAALEGGRFVEINRSDLTVHD
jgi:predicted nuclease of predicted toxin-antitoxin system